jgi:hypothetical protein
VLLAGPKAEEWCRCALSATSEDHAALDIRRPGAEGLEDSTGCLPELHGIAPDGCVLVRPDGFIAWRARNAQGASAATLKSALSGAGSLPRPHDLIAQPR